MWRSQGEDYKCPHFSWRKKLLSLSLYHPCRSAKHTSSGAVSPHDPCAFPRVAFSLSLLPLPLFLSLAFFASTFSLLFYFTSFTFCPPLSP